MPPSPPEAEPGRAVPGPGGEPGRPPSPPARGEGARCERRRRHLAARGGQRSPAARGRQPARHGEALPGPPARPPPQGLSHPSACGFPRDSAKDRAPSLPPLAPLSPPPKRSQSFRCKVEINTKRVLPFRGVVFACSPPRGTETQKNGSSFPFLSPHKGPPWEQRSSAGGAAPATFPLQGASGPAPPRGTARAFGGTSRSPEGRKK